MKLIPIPIIALILLITAHAHAWGYDGHRIIANLGELPGPAPDGWLHSERLNRIMPYT